MLNNNYFHAVKNAKKRPTTNLKMLLRVLGSTCMILHQGKEKLWLGG
jgi:hypothetical protein